MEQQEDGTACPARYCSHTMPGADQNLVTTGQEMPVYRVGGVVTATIPGT